MTEISLSNSYASKFLEDGPVAPVVSLKAFKNPFKRVWSVSERRRKMTSGPPKKGEEAKKIKFSNFNINQFWRVLGLKFRF